MYLFVIFASNCCFYEVFLGKNVLQKGNFRAKFGSGKGGSFSAMDRAGEKGFSLKKRVVFILVFLQIKKEGLVLSLLLF